MLYSNPKNGSQPTSVARCATKKIHRKAEIVDTLVFMIAGLLIPAWLLGHLFLTFYPAPESVNNSADLDGTNLTNVSGSSESESELPSVDGSESNQSTEQIDEPNTGLTSAQKEKLASLSNDYQALLARHSDVERNMATLQKENVALESEVASLKSTAAKMSSDGGDSNAAETLRAQLDNASQKLTTTQQTLANTETKLQSTETEMQTLRTNLADTQSKLELAQSNLAAAEKRSSQMAANSDSDESSPFAQIPSEDDGEATLVAEANAKVAELQQEVKSLNQRINSANETLAIRDKELNATKLDMQDISSQNSDLKTALNAAKQAAEKLKIQSELPKEVYRDFVSSKGSVSKMAFVRWEGEDVIVRSFSNKKLYRLTLDRFGDADQQYLREQK